MPSERTLRLKASCRDFILIAALVIAAALSALFIYIFPPHKGSYVLVTVKGREYARYLLERSDPVTFTIENSDGINEVTIRDGEVFVTYADCPSGLCAKQRPISRVGQSIICLPHEVIISIEGDASNEEAIDAVCR